MFQRGVIYEVKEGGGRYISVDGNVMFCSSGRAWIKSAASERDLIYLLGEGVIAPLVDNEAIPQIGISDAKIPCEINDANVETWKDGELKRFLGDVIHQSVENSLSKEIADTVDKLYRKLSQRNAQIEGMEVELSGSNGRCKLILEAKNYWADRARKAEAQVAELDERIIRYAGIATARAEHVAEQEKQIAALTAENVALKELISDYAKHKTAFDDFDGDRRGIAEHLYEAEQALIAGVETSATDAAANTLRAEGGAKALEDFAQFNIKSIGINDEYEEQLREVARAARAFANKLREGR